MKPTEHARNLAIYAFITMFGIAGTPVVTWAVNPFWFLAFPSLIAAGLVGSVVYIVSSFLPDLIYNYQQLQMQSQIEQNEPDTAEPEPVANHTQKPQSTPQRPNLPIQSPIREQRTAEFVTVNEPVQVRGNYPDWIRKMDLPEHIKREWVIEIWQARKEGKLSKVSANRIHSVTGADRTNYDVHGRSQAQQLVDWLIDNHYIHADSVNSQHEWNGKGNAHFPSPIEMAIA